MAGQGSEYGVLSRLFMFAQVATYYMAIPRWLFSEHDAFWLGFKELLWAMCPIANFLYVWDWWLLIIRTAYHVMLYLAGTISDFFKFVSEISFGTRELIALLFLAAVVAYLWRISVVREQREEEARKSLHKFLDQ